MTKYKITIKAEMTYDIVTEDLTEDEAVDIAFGLWEDYVPEIEVEKVE